MPIRRLATLAIACSTLLVVPAAGAPQSSWYPILLGKQPLASTSASLGEELLGVVGGAQFADGSFVVADDGEFRLHLFNSRGQRVRDFGRRGRGPGEVEAATELLHCGDSVVVVEGSSRKMSVFNRSGDYVRAFSVAAYPNGGQPRRTGCNAHMDFIHVAWSLPTDAKPGRYRARVPVWLTKLAGASTTPLGSWPGTESILVMRNGKPSGARPQPLGNDLLVALGTRYAWLLDTERTTITQLLLSGSVAGTIELAGRSSLPSKGDIARALEEEAGGRSDQSVRAEFANMDFSRVLPSASEMFLSDSDQLWVGMYRRADQREKDWRVYSEGANRYGRLRLPGNWRVLSARKNTILVLQDNGDGVGDVRLYSTREDR